MAVKGQVTAVLSGCVVLRYNGHGCVCTFTTEQYQRLREVKALRAMAEVEATPPPDEIMRLKRCVRCHDTKPLTEFYHDATRHDGHTYCCKACIKDIVRRGKAR